MSLVMHKESNVEAFAVVERLTENLSLIKNAGFHVYSSREYSKVEGNRILAKYKCKYENWDITIRDILNSTDEGTLGVEEIECLTTGKVYKTNCNLRGSEIDKTRLERLKEVMTVGRNSHMEVSNQIMLQLQTLFEDDNLTTTSKLSKSSFLPKGSITISDNSHSIYINIDEDANGNASIKVANDSFWSNPAHNTSKMTGRMFPLNIGSVVEVYNYAIELFEDMKTNKVYPLPYESYKEGYNWMG